MSNIDVLAVAKLPTFLLVPLTQAFTVHERLHETDAACSTRPRRASAASPAAASRRSAPR